MSGVSMFDAQFVPADTVRSLIDANSGFGVAFVSVAQRRLCALRSSGAALSR